jgi:glycerol-3-phosphate dehydrogenase (NAD(P)+)
MGTAITFPLSDNGHEVRLVGTHLDTDIIEEIHQDRRHPKLRSSVPEGVLPFTIQQLNEAFEEIDLVILGVNSLGVRWAAETLANLIEPGIPVLSLTKGLEGDGERLVLLPEVFRTQLPGRLTKEIRIAAVGGPSIAGELAARRSTSVVITGEDVALLTSIQALLSTAYYHVSINTDVTGVEMAVGLKNLYAIGVGIVQGMLDSEQELGDRDAMHNLAGALFTRSLEEIAYLVEVNGGRRETVYALPGVGDLYVTCQGGRNSRIGRYLGLGMTYQEAREKYLPGETIEGVELAFAIRETVDLQLRNGQLEPGRLPLLRSLLDIVSRQAPAASTLKDASFT